MAQATPEYESALTDALRALIGQEGAQAEHEITAPSVRAFARAAGLNDSVFYDRAEAKRRGYRDLPAPPGHLGFPVFDPVRSDPLLSWPLDPKAPLNHPFIPISSRHTDVLAGGSEIEYFGDPDLCAGDVLTSVTKLENLTERYSEALGGPMLIQTTSTTFKKNGQPVAIYRFTIISYTPKAKG